MKYIILCLLPALLHVQAGEFSSEDRYLELDPADLVIIANQTYYVGPKDVFLNAVDATRACNDLGMKLVSFENEEKWIDISEYLTNIGYADQFSFWTSGRYLSNSIWMWTSTGEEFTYTDWLAKEPNLYDEYEDICVDFTLHQSWAGWGDDFCSYTFRLICQL